MPTALTALFWLHVGAGLAWAGCALVLLASPDRVAAARTGDVAAGLFAAAALPLLGLGGWWVDMPSGKIVPAIVLLALALAAFGSHHPAGRPATLALAAFFLTLGVISVRNGGPLAGFMVAKAILFGVALALLPWHAAIRARAALLVLLLAAGAMAGLQRGIPFG